MKTVTGGPSESLAPFELRVGGREMTAFPAGAGSSAPRPPTPTPPTPPPAPYVPTITCGEGTISTL